MALIKCPECGREVSDRAKSCPNCGFPFESTVNDGSKDINEGEDFHRKTQDSDAKQREKNQEQTKVPKPLIALAMLVVVLAVAVVVVYITQYKPQHTETVNNGGDTQEEGAIIVESEVYEEAIALLENEEYDDAYALLETIPGYKDVDELLEQRDNYEEAVALLESGEYNDAYVEFQTLQGYRDVDELLEQMKYESYAYSCIIALMDNLKNPASFVPYEITFYSGLNVSGEFPMIEAAVGTNYTYPICVMRYTAENSFGGTTTEYALFACKSKVHGYIYIGSCDSLNKDNYESGDVEYSIAVMINTYDVANKTVGSVDLKRIKSVLEIGNYDEIDILD